MGPLALALLLSCPWPGDGPDFVHTQLEFPVEGLRLALRDFSGDGRLDLLAADAAGARLHRQRADGSFEAAPSAWLAWPEGRTAWDLADLEGNGRCEVLVLSVESGVTSFELGDEGEFRAGRSVLRERSWLPRGASAVRFARDVDGDGRVDLVLPGPRSHRIFLRREDGSFAAPLEVAYRAAVSLGMGDPERLDGRISRGVEIPWFRVEDIDGDGLPDLVSETPERVAFHLARADREPALPPEPTWVLDLEALRAELPRTGRLNLEDLLDNVPDLVAWRVADLDGEPPNDLVVALGNRFRVYRGGALTGPREQPDQLLLASGKILGFFLRDVTGDARPDLQLLRGERISLGRALRYLVLPGRIDFEVFTYANEEGAFSRRPTRRGTLGLLIPRLLSFLERAEDLSLRVELQLMIPARPIAFGADGLSNDVVDLVDEELVVYADCGPDPRDLEGLIEERVEFEALLETLALRELDRRGDGAEVVFDLGELDRQVFGLGLAVRRACLGREPLARAPFPYVPDATLKVLDLDGDGRHDVLGFGKQAERWIVRLFVRAGGSGR